MLLNQTAIYALRAMSCLALEQRAVAAVGSKDLAEKTGVPQHYLSKIMRRMVEAGLVDSKKGHGGGFSLARSPEEIRFVDLLEAVDLDAEAGVCVFAWGRCDPDNPCPLHPFWSQLNQSHSQWAENNTLADVVERFEDEL